MASTSASKEPYLCKKAVGALLIVRVCREEGVPLGFRKIVANGAMTERTKNGFEKFGGVADHHWMGE